MHSALPSVRASVRPSFLVVPVLLAAPLAIWPMVASAAPCDEYAKAQRIISAGAVGGSSTSTTTTTTSSGSHGGRAIAVRVENGKVSVEVDGQSVPESRIRREGDRLTILDASGAPMPGLPPIAVMDGSGSIVIRSGSSGGDADAALSDVMVEARALAESWGPRIKAEVERAVAEASRAASSAGRAVSESGAAADLLRRLVSPTPGGGFGGGSGGDAPSVSLRMSAPKVMLGVTLAEPDEALIRHLALTPGETTMLADVRPDLPAAKAGLESFDIVVAVDGGTPADPATIRSSLAARNAGDSIKFTVRRGPDTKQYSVVLEPFDGARFGSIATRGFELEADSTIEPLMRMLQGQIRVAPMQNGEGDFLFEVEPPAGGVWQGGRVEGSAKAESGSHADSGSGSASGSSSSPSPQWTAPRVRTRTPAAGDGSAQRLEQLEQRLDEVSKRLERVLEKLEKSERWNER